MRTDDDGLGMSGFEEVLDIGCFCHHVLYTRLSYLFTFPKWSPSLLNNFKRGLHIFLTAVMIITQNLPRIYCSLFNLLLIVLFTISLFLYCAFIALLLCFIVLVLCYPNKGFSCFFLSCRANAKV
jgi:hypothetical protein